MRLRLLMIINFSNKQKLHHYLRTKDLGFVFERERDYQSEMMAR